MRNVMVRCIFSALSVGICIVGILGQEIHRYQQWDQQVLADEWKPFVPGFPPRQVESFPQRTDSSRQFFGKVPEPVQVVPVQQNLYKKSFQTAASANTIEPFVVPPILGSFNTFGLQTIQARNPHLDKNIKDNQFLDQGTHLHPKYFPQNAQQQQQQQQQQLQQQQPQRFPPVFLQPQHQHQQYLPQQQHYPTPYRLENVPKPQSLIQAPSKTIQTSVQIFPPNPPNPYQPNNYFLGSPQKQESYEDEEAFSRKQQQPLPRPNDFLLNTNNIATIYGHRDPSLNIPPPALKPTPFIRNEQIQDHFFYEGGLKPAPQRYEPLNGFNKRPYEPQQQQIKHHELKKPHEDNPSKQVFEQLSQFSRPFSLPREPAREPVTEHSRPKPDQGIDELGQNYDIPVEHYKKEKPKPSHLPHKPAFDRIPPSASFQEVSTATNLLDYEPGKLQSIKSVTYLPQRDVIQFNEEDVAGGVKQYQNNEKYNSFTRTPFLPTPTESEDEHSFGAFQKITTPPQKLTTSALPKNHKYFSIQHTSNRNRYPQQVNYNPEPPKYFTSTESAEQIVYEDKQKYAPVTTQKPVDYEIEQQYETTTRKAGTRRRKPSKGNKNKDQVRYKTSQPEVSTTSSTINNEYYASNDIPSTEASIQYTTKKKATKHTTAKPEDDYPNYPQYVKQQENYPNYPAKQQENYPNYPAKQQDNYPNYPAKQQENYPNYPAKQQDNYPNYPKEFLQQSGLLQSNYDSSNSGSDYFNSEKQEEKENYPQTVTSSQSTTTTTTPESTTSSLKTRIKNKYSNSTRPRFSIKDYKRTTAASTQSTPTSTTESLEEPADTEKKPIRKVTFASRSKNKTESAKSAEESTSESLRKYKPRTRPSKYRTTTTTLAPDTTTERVNTFKPSTSNRVKTSTSKYYNRFRTTTEITGNDAEEPSAASSDKKPVRTMLFSAKRSSVLKTKSTTTPKAEESQDESVDEAEDSPAPIVKKNTISQFKPNTKLDKADDASQTNIMTSSEEQNEKKEIAAAAETAKKAAQADAEIDITTSSEEESDDFSSEVADPKENEVTTPSSLSIVADDRMDDADRVSKVSSLTSLDESDLPISFFQKWPTNGNQKQ
ncbi:mucin-2-like [Planococcus citri]|uniref:mucin-2-like n=1 Tax=Planococcus citri TaxID=170843 RepID=UPI0031F79659